MCVCVVCVLKPLFLSFFYMNIYLFCAKFMGDILVFRVFLSFIDMKNTVGFLFVSPHVCVWRPRWDCFCGVSNKLSPCTYNMKTGCDCNQWNSVSKRVRARAGDNRRDEPGSYTNIRSRSGRQRWCNACGLLITARSIEWFGRPWIETTGVTVSNKTTPK